MISSLILVFYYILINTIGILWERADLETCGPYDIDLLFHFAHFVLATDDENESAPEKVDKARDSEDDAGSELEEDSEDGGNDIEGSDDSESDGDSDDDFAPPRRGNK